jgi:hypothetical protein
MSWQRRLVELALAGGALAGCGNPTTTPDQGYNPDMFFACNLNPDPCCAHPQSTACLEKMKCLSEGGQWSYGSRSCIDLDGGTHD